MAAASPLTVPSSACACWPAPARPWTVAPQARRVAARLERFKRAEIDFEGVPDIGHAFADELFRVFGLNHREVELVPVNANKRILALIDNARTG